MYRVKNLLTPINNRFLQVASHGIGTFRHLGARLLGHLLDPLGDRRAHRHRHRWTHVAKHHSGIVTDWVDGQTCVHPRCAAANAVRSELGVVRWRWRIWRMRDHVAQELHRLFADQLAAVDRLNKPKQITGRWPGGRRPDIRAPVVRR